jgi:mannose-1-phosphate guanylyltransferase
MKKSNYYGLIMAGGRGTRFWPRSRRSHAKQVLRFFGEKTLIQQAVDRLKPFLSPDRIWIITNDFLRDEIVRQLPEVPKKQILAEPAARNTAPCIGLAAHIMGSIDPDAVMGVFPADHIVTKPAAYLKLVKSAFRAAEKGEIVVLGIKPRWPETGYGYINFPKDVQAGSPAPYPVLQFKEKPDGATAKRYVQAGNYYWNSGQFFWRADVFLAALHENLPKTATLLASLPDFSSRDFHSTLKRVFPKTENISVDYAVIEKANQVVGLAAGEIGWNDVGSWNAVYEIGRKDGGGNAGMATMLLEGASGNFVDAQGKLVALLGVKDLVIVDTKDALLIADRSRAQDVSKLVKMLEKQGREDLL